MKKFICVFFIALCAVACVEPLQPYPGLIVNEPEDDNSKVTVEFTLPPTTKGTMAHNPTIETIHVAVFTQAGVLKQYEKAYLTNKENLTNGNAATNPSYAVDLYMSKSPRILHFIADSPVDTYEDLIALAGTSGESSILNALKTEGGVTAYWQRFVLEGGVTAYTYNGVSFLPEGADQPFTGASYTYEDPLTGATIKVNKGDYIKRDGTKVLDGTGYFQSDEVAEALANIPFIRNFAEITVGSTSTSNFIPHIFALVNVPTAGYVAPYDATQATFASAYLANNLTTAGLTHTDIAGTHYPGMLCGNIDDSMPKSFIDLDSDDVKTAYMYERSLPSPTQPATCILVAGEYDVNGDGDYTDDDGAVRNSEGLTWLKIEITDEDGAYFPIYRGVSYKMLIGEVSGTHGYDTPDKALEHDPVGDVSGSVETMTLEEISDGKGTTLRVEYIDWVATGETSKTLYYTMYYQNGDDIEYLTPDVKLTVSHPNADAAYKAIDDSNIDEDNPLTGVPYNGSERPFGNKQCYIATIPLKSVSGVTRQSYLHVEGLSHVGRKMYRDVSYRVMGTQQFKNGNNELKATPLDNEEKGKETFLTIYLPSDLGFSMFPLHLMIEAKNGHYTTVDGLPVESGPSLFDSNKNAFYFIKTIEYDDYYNADTQVTTTAFTTTFKTTYDCTESGTNATDFRVLDKIQENRGRTEPFFEVAECSVTVGGPTFFITPESVQVAADDKSTTFRITSRGEENPTWTLSPSNNVESISSTTGEGSRNITVNIPANNTARPAEYTVTATRQGYDTQVFTILQAAAVFELSASNVTVGPDAISASFDITSTGDSTWDLSASTGASVSTNSGSGNATINVSFNRNNSAEDKTYTITASREGFLDKTFVVKQEGLSVTLTPEAATVKATETSATFSISSNSTLATWTISKSDNVTSVTRSNGSPISSGQGNISNLRVDFPENPSFEQEVIYTVTVTIGGAEKHFTITQSRRGSAPKTVTFNTNTRNTNFPNNTNSRTQDGVTLDFGSSIRRSGYGSSSNSYLVINDGGQFTISSASSITAITIHYTEYSFGRSGNEYQYSTTMYSTSNPLTQSGSIYATNNGDTGTWTGESFSVTFTMYDYYDSTTVLGFTLPGDHYRTRIESIEVTYIGEE